MKTIRKKIIDLLDEFPVQMEWHDNADLANFLLSHGVTVQENCKACAEATQNCIVKLQEQIAELRSVQEWISVKDRLPEESGMYIVTANDGHAQRVSFVLWQKRNKAWNLTGARSYWRVTHWQPMPQPPKGE